MINPDRKLILDLSAMEEARGPQPNDYFVCITRKEATYLLVPLAGVLAGEEMRKAPENLVNALRRLFWDIANELGPSLQRTLFKTLDAQHLAIPSCPWEEHVG